jgi:pyruvate dehydrogenase E2 component (dihydrolipoamide acetyltransferase)
MVSEVVMPRLGWTMETGKIVQWHKRDGDMVTAGEIVLEVEGDKAVSEVEALDSGILRIAPDVPQEGADVPVGAVLAYLVPAGEQAPFEKRVVAGLSHQVHQEHQEGFISSPSSDAPGHPGGSMTSTAPTAAASTRAISPRARRVAAELGIDWTTLTATGTSGRIAERDVRAAVLVAQLPGRAARISPLARRAAANAGVDIATVTSDAPGQRITRADVAAAAQATTAAPASDDVTTAMSQVRRITAVRMAESAHTVAPVTLTTDADVTELLRLHTQLAAALAGSGDLAPSFTALLVRLVAVALREHPALNASIDGERIVQHNAVHIGIAVDTERGLLVPVIRDALSKSVQQIGMDAAALIGHARTGRARADDLSGGTFTITNLGMYDIDAFTPIINLPECAILGVGRFVPRPVVTDEAAGTIAVRKMMALSLTFDHRVVDGAPAARFLQRIRQFIEQPMLWLTR